MRRLVLTLTTLAVVGLAAGTALAGHGYRGYGRGYGRNVYGGYGGYGRHQYSRSWGPSFGSSLFSQQVRRVQANHSRYRYNYHPRSYYNSPPHRYDYWGW
ncbi:MAG: hypothetical protein ACYSWU_08130 [Planctomycetota bacterium]|jgi:hypothetical protein